MTTTTRLSQLICLIFILAATSCIKKESPNTVADIISIKVPQEILKVDPVIQNKSVMVMVKGGTNLKSIAPDFELTPGATINPPGKTARDFTNPQKYVVTSEDGKWQKAYTISFIDADLETRFNFEDTLKRNTKYYIFVEKESNQIIMEWGSGNSGYAITGVPKSPEDYPTLQSSDGRTGKCLKLITRSTGSFGAGVGMPLAAGNLFIGTFDVLNALSNPLKATKFGIPFKYNPTYLSGYYKYKAGSIYTEGGKVVTGKKDIFNIYAMFFETDETVQQLDGTNQLSHKNIISSAEIDNAVETTQWKRFEIPFILRDGKSVDPVKLAAGKYSIAIVFTSSLHGDVFNGSEGSTLMIDDVEVLYSNLSK